MSETGQKSETTLQSGRELEKMLEPHPHFSQGTIKTHLARVKQPCTTEEDH